MVTRKALWIDGWSTPAWVKARLNKVSQDYPKDKNGKRNTSSISARELRLIVKGDDGRMHLQRTSTTNEAIAILKDASSNPSSLNPVNLAFTETFMIILYTYSTRSFLYNIKTTMKIKYDI